MDRTRIELAEDALGTGDAAGALRLLDAHLALHPHDEDARALREAALGMQREQEGAREDFGGLRPDTRHLDDEPMLHAPEPAPARPAPPWGVMALAALHVVVAAALGILAFAAFLRQPGVGMLLGLAAIPVAGLAVGLWRLRRWAWLILVVLHGIGAFVALARVSGGDWASVLGVVFNGGIVLYLARVSRAFGEPARRPARPAPAP